MCATHGLRYDPSINIGCVVCRRPDAPVESVGQYSLGQFAMSIGVAGAVVILGLYGLDWITGAPPYVNFAEMVSGTASDHANCFAGCAETHRACDDACTEDSEDPACRNFCFTEADPCFTKCAKRAMRVEVPWSYRYGTASMPAWSAILESTLGIRPRLIECAEDPVIAHVYVSVDGRGGPPDDVAVWSSAMTPPLRACTLEVLRTTEFPASDRGDYSFMAIFDNRYDGPKLLLEQAQQELSALGRLRTSDSGERLRARIFDAKVRVASRQEQPLSSDVQRLAEARERVALLRENLKSLRGSLSNYEPAKPKQAPSMPAREDDPRRDLAKAEKAKAARAQAQIRQAERDLRHYQQVNEDFRQRDRDAAEQRRWEAYWEQRRRR